ncbi:MAG: hypothetical protein FJ100_09010 [Deltaproteobacteria bacterium]|nr:hypothetical protein [Deltaproteobacteria bacterium]
MRTCQNQFFNLVAALCAAGLVAGCAASTPSGSTGSADTASIDGTTGGDASAGGDTAAKTDTAGGETAAAAAIEIAGTYNDNFGGSETIASDKWQFSFGTSTIVQYDNAKNDAYLQAPADDKFNPSKFSKIVWTEPKVDSFYYCTVVIGAATLDLAKASTLTADDKNPEKTGCGGVGWTKLTKKK